MCGRRKVERDYPEIVKKWGDMDYEMVQSIAKQIPGGVVVQFHNNGEPLLYTRFGEAVSLFGHCVRCVDTNGKLIMEKADEIIGNLDTLTLSTFEGDTEADEQYETFRRFIELKGSRKPNVIVRTLGEMDETRYRELDVMVAHRQLHSPMGSFSYTHTPTIPEIGICLEALHHLSIQRDGAVSMCVRFDPHRQGVIGNVKDKSLNEIWNGRIRKYYLQEHIRGNRDRIPLCERCEYWGVPKG